MTSPAANLMFFKVRVKPTNKHVIHISANFYENFTSNNALCIAEIPINADTTLATVQAKVETLRVRYNAKRAVVVYQDKVVKILTPTMK